MFSVSNRLSGASARHTTARASTMSRYIEGYVVVCKDGHGARGLYPTESEAQSVKAEQERISACKYMVVEAEITLERFMN